LAEFPRQLGNVITRDGDRCWTKQPLVVAATPATVGVELLKCLFYTNSVGYSTPKRQTHVAPHQEELNIQISPPTKRRRPEDMSSPLGVLRHRVENPSGNLPRRYETPPRQSMKKCHLISTTDPRRRDEWTATNIFRAGYMGCLLQRN
jgi:hypothetical protein